MTKTLRYNKIIEKWLRKGKENEQKSLQFKEELRKNYQQTKTKELRNLKCGETKTSD